MVDSTQTQSAASPRSGGLQGAWLWLAKSMLAGIPLFAMAYAFNLTSYFGYAMWGQQATLVVLGLGLGATFLVKPAGTGAAGNGGRPPLYDVLLSAAGLLFCLWAAVRYEWLVSIGYLGSGADYYINLSVAVLTLCLVLEALRRLTGWIMVILVVASLLYALVAQYLPGPFEGRTPSFDFFMGYLHLDAGGLLGTPLAVVVSTVIAFVLLGNALFELGGGQIFLDLPLSIAGRYRGGPAKAAVVASSLFGSISGSAVANVATTGLVTIPLMKKTGYAPYQAGAVEAVASTGGQLLPPIMGAAAFIMAEFLGVPYADVAIAATIPALLFYTALFFQIHLHAARNGHRALTREERPNAWKTFRRYWPFLIPIILLLYLLMVSRWNPEQAAFASLLAVLGAAAMLREHSIGPRALFDVLQSTGRSLLDIIVICAAAGIIIGVLSITGLSFSLGMSIAASAGSILLVALLIAAITAIVFGMGMPTTAVYVLMAALIAPVLVNAGIEPMAAHLFVLYYGVLSMITPPVCIASFAAASLAGAPFMRTGVQSVRFGMVAFIVPFMFIAEPELLLADPSWMGTGRAVVTAVVGCLLVAAAAEGYFFRTLCWPLRLLALAAGLLLVTPVGWELPFAPGVHADVLGALLAALAVAWAWWRSRGAVALALE